MKNLPPPLLAYLKHYAAELRDALAAGILDGRPIENEENARGFRRFLDAMLDRAVKDQRAGVTVLGQKAHASDAEKACLAAEDALAEAGFEDPLDDDGDSSSGLGR